MPTGSIPSPDRQGGGHAELSSVKAPQREAVAAFAPSKRGGHGLLWRSSAARSATDVHLFKASCCNRNTPPPVTTLRNVRISTKRVTPANFFGRDFSVQGN